MDGKRVRVTINSKKSLGHIYTTSVMKQKRTTHSIQRLLSNTDILYKIKNVIINYTDGKIEFKHSRLVTANYRF